MKTNWRSLCLIIGLVLLSFIAGYFIHDTLECYRAATELEHLYLAIVDCDSNTYAVKTDSYVRIDPHLTLAEQCQSLADQLSRLRFGNLPIEVVSIEQRDSRSVAIINLRDREGPLRHSWRAGYFQGSCGGMVTSTTLVETFLQRDHAGAWFDGVEFLYEENRISEFQHVCDLFYVNWRDTL